MSKKLFFGLILSASGKILLFFSYCIFICIICFELLTGRKRMCTERKKNKFELAACNFIALFLNFLFVCLCLYVIFCKRNIFLRLFFVAICNAFLHSCRFSSSSPSFSYLLVCSQNNFNPSSHLDDII